MHYVRKKNGKIRIVNDSKKLNEWTRRPSYPMVTAKQAVEAVPPEARYFSTADASSGYWQIPLDKASQDLTTFMTPWGRYKYTRATMGLVSTGDEYNYRMDVALRPNLGTVSKIVDDVLIHGSGRGGLPRDLPEEPDQVGEAQVRHGAEERELRGIHSRRRRSEARRRQVEGHQEVPGPAE